MECPSGWCRSQRRKSGGQKTMTVLGKGTRTRLSLVPGGKPAPTLSLSLAPTLPPTHSHNPTQPRNSTIKHEIIRYIQIIGTSSLFFILGQVISRHYFILFFIEFYYRIKNNTSRVKYLNQPTYSKMCNLKFLSIFLIN
jgi:hypothetical protein